MKEGFELAAALIFILAVGALIYSVTHIIRLGTWVIPLISFAVVTLKVLSQFKGFEWMDLFTGNYVKYKKINSSFILKILKCIHYVFRNTIQQRQR